MMKRIATVQDLSCLGRCSLTVALPVISAMGVECGVVPTAVLSTHTMFSRCRIRDLTEDIPGILDHWEEEEFSFDALYTGYLASQTQVEQAADLFRRFRGEGSFALVDPVMGDHGRLYTGFDRDFVRQMAGLCALADIVVPNLTEACFLLGMEYPENGVCDREEARMILKKLTGLGARVAILTGLSFAEGEIGALGYDSRTREEFSCFVPRVNASYHGTGDLFAAALTAGLVRGMGMEKALPVASDFVRECMAVTLENQGLPAAGVQFEAVLPWLIRRMEREGL